MLQRPGSREWETLRGVSEARVARQVIFVETSKGRFISHRPSSSVMPRPICSCSGTCFPGPGRPRDPPLPTHVLAERVLLTCPLSQRYYCPFTTYDVEVPNNIIFLRPDTATGLASPVRPHYFCARLRSPAVYPTALGNNAVWITCTAVSANGRPRAHLTQANPSMSLSPSRLRCLQTPHSTRELRLLWTTALLYTSLSSSIQITLLLFSPLHSLSSLPHALQHRPRVTAATLPSPPWIVRHKLGC